MCSVRRLRPPKAGDADGDRRVHAWSGRCACASASPPSSKAPRRRRRCACGGLENSAEAANAVAELAEINRLLQLDPETPGAAARARRPLHRASRRRRPAAHAGNPADGPQPAWLRSLPHPQRLRDAGRRAPGRSRARALRSDGNPFPEIDRPGALGHRQSEERGRSDRAGARASLARARASTPMAGSAARS